MKKILAMALSSALSLPSHGMVFFGQVDVVGSRSLDDWQPMNATEYSYGGYGRGGRMVERDGDGPTPKTGPDTPAFAGRVANLCAVGRADVAHTVSSVKDPLGNPVPNDFYARRDAAAAVAGMVVAEATALNPMNVMQFMRRTVTVRVEYADGGTEMWYMNVFSTDNVRPVSGSLKLGDGVDRNASC